MVESAFPCGCACCPSRLCFYFYFYLLPKLLGTTTACAPHCVTAAHAEGAFSWGAHRHPHSGARICSVGACVHCASSRHQVRLSLPASAPSAHPCIRLLWDEGHSNRAVLLYLPACSPLVGVNFTREEAVSATLLGPVRALQSRLAPLAQELSTDLG